MPEEENRSTTFLIVILVIVVLITIGLVGLYFFGGPKGTPAFLRKFDSTSTNSAQNKANGKVNGKDEYQTTIYEGYVQDLVQKEKTENGLTYTYSIGLLDKNEQPLPVWLTDEEFNNLEIFTNVNGGREEGTLNDIKGGQFLKITRQVPSSTPELSSVTIDILTQ